MEQFDFPVLISRWIHIVAAGIVVGGPALMLFALIPGAKETLSEDDHARLREAVRKRWAKWVHASIGLLLLTGFVNFYLLAIRSGVEPIPYHAVFGLKLVAALAIFFLTTALVGRAPGLEKMRRAAPKWLAVVLALAATVILLGDILNQLRG